MLLYRTAVRQHCHRSSAAQSRASNSMHPLCKAIVANGYPVRMTTVVLQTSNSNLARLVLSTLLKHGISCACCALDRKDTPCNYATAVSSTCRSGHVSPHRKYKQTRATVAPCNKPPQHRHERFASSHTVPCHRMTTTISLWSKHLLGYHYSVPSQDLVRPSHALHQPRGRDLSPLVLRQIAVAQSPVSCQ